MPLFKKRDQVQVPPLEEIGVFISDGLKLLINNEFGVKKTSNNFWQFTRDIAKIGIKQNDFLIAIDQKDVRQEKNVEVLFEKCFRKNVSEDIYFSIVRKEYEESLIHLGKKVRHLIQKIFVWQCMAVYGRVFMYRFNQNKPSGA